LAARQAAGLVAPDVERLAVQPSGLLRTDDVGEPDDQMLAVAADRDDLDRPLLLAEVQPLTPS
jgi:hypothetical protein